MTNERKTRDVEGILHFLTRQQMAEEIVRLDAALAQALRLPNDFRILPVEATDAMMDADWDVTMSDAHCNGGVSAAAWRAMAEAAPQVTYGNGHSGPGWYMHDNEYPEEGALFLSDTSADERAVLAAARPLPQATLSEERGRFGVAVSLLNECLGPLEVSAAIVESDDGDQMEALIERVRKFVKDARAVLAAARQVPAGITLTMEQAQWVFDALDIGLGAATQEAAAYHETMKGYRPLQHKALDDDAAKVSSALTMLGQMIEDASPVGQEEPGHKCGEGVGIVGVPEALAEQCAEHGECTEKAMGEPECVGQCKVAAGAPATRTYLHPTRVDALIEVLEGECDGLAVSRETAEAILHYLDGNAPSAPGVKGLGDGQHS